MDSQRDLSRRALYHGQYALSNLGEDVDGFSEESWQVRVNNCLLAAGKFVDIMTDWVLVVQLGRGTFGTRPILYVATFICAMAGTLVELYALFILKFVKSKRAAKEIMQLNKVLLNRKLAWWRCASSVAWDMA